MLLLLLLCGSLCWCLLLTCEALAEARAHVVDHPGLGVELQVICLV